MLASAFLNPSGVISAKRAVGIPAGLVYVSLYIIVVLINLIFRIEIDNIVLQGIDNLGYLCTGLLTATIADIKSKKPSKSNTKSLFCRLIQTSNKTISSKKFVGVITGFSFCILQIVITFCNVFFGYKLSENVFNHSRGLILLCLVLLGVDVAKPSIQKIQSFFRK